MTAADRPFFVAIADRYRIEREIGAGGMATVYLAEDVRHRRRVAIKVLREELSLTLGADRFLREISIAASLQNPHILPLFDSGEAAGSLYYVMPFVEGSTLRERLARERELPVGDAVQVLRDILDAMTIAHTSGVVHRDLKPENIMLSGRHALVADFGVAKAVSASTGSVTLTTVGIALGTPAYMAPEQATADPLTDHRADIYALGVIAYEMLCGELPFVRATPQAMLAAHVVDAPTPLAEKRSNIPVPLADLVMRCLQKNPADRPQSADEMLLAVESLVASGALASGGLTPTDARPRATTSVDTGMKGTGIVASRHQRWALPGVVVLMLTAGGLWWARGSEGEKPMNPRVRTPVAVAPFEVRVTDASLKSLGVDVAERIVAEVQKIGAGPVISARELTQLAFTEENVRSAAVSTEASTLVFGSVTERNGEVQFEARVVRAADRLTLWTLGPERAPIASASQAMEAMTERAAAAVGYYTTGILSEGFSNAGLTRAPRNLEALRQGEAGVAQHFEGGSLQQSMQKLRAAIASDSGWTQPYYLLWAGLYNAGGNLEELNRLRGALLDRRASLPAWDAELVTHLTAWLDSPEAEYKSSNALWQIDSLAFPYIQLWTAVRARRPREALRYFAARDTTRRLSKKWQAWQSMAAMAHHELGEYEAELSVARQARAREPRSVTHWMREARALTVLRRDAELDRLVTEAAALELATGRLAVLGSALEEAEAHHLPKSTTLANQLLAAYAVLPTETKLSSHVRSIRETALRVLGRYREAAEGYAADPLARLEAARYRVLRGDTAVAVALVDSAATWPDSLYGSAAAGSAPLLARAQLSAMLGRKDEAVSLLREALNKGHRLWPDDELAVFWSNVRNYPPFVELTRIR